VAGSVRSGAKEVWLGKLAKRLRLGSDLVTKKRRGVLRASGSGPWDKDGVPVKERA
jgi:predicted Zn-dependent protease